MDKVFYKTLQGHTPKQIEALFDHARVVFEGLKGINGILFPEPLSFDEKGIIYQYLDLPPLSLSELLKDRTCSQDMLFRTGKALSLFHQHAKNDALHSDFVPHNLFEDKGKLYLIDAHPPEYLGYRADLLYGNQLKDVVSFVYCIFSNVGARAVLSSARYYTGMASAFLQGYGPSSIAFAPLMRALYRQFCDVVIMKRKAGMGRLHATLHALFYAKITLLVSGKVLWIRKR